MNVTDTQLQAAQLLGAESRSDTVRGARIAALQTTLVGASAEENFRRTLVFIHVVREADAAGLPDVTAQLPASDPELHPATVWADWLCGEYKPLHRRRVVAEFAEGITTDATVVEKGYLESVKVLGENVDTKNCDSVFSADVRGSMPNGMSDQQFSPRQGPLGKAPFVAGMHPPSPGTTPRASGRRTASYRYHHQHIGRELHGFQPHIDVWEQHIIQ
ncbi:hypothetical protein [Streptomyces sp. NPDC051546]|uniref:hypothetical protein n=1 Tax=Streptomyces sp. NPDC051546 TaxID=3365655 RepID=UPI0037984E61